MKLSLNADFTQLPRAGSVIRAHDLPGHGRILPFDIALLPHDEREMRRRVVELVHGDKVLVDLLEQTVLASGDVLVLDDGRHVEIIAGEEQVFDIRPRDPVHLAELAWHLGGMHVAVMVEPDRILILRDDAVRTMLEDMGAKVTEASEPFEPLRAVPFEGRAHGHHDHHHHDHHHGHDHDHHHGEPDRFGRYPGDPHYGHNHG